MSDFQSFLFQNMHMIGLEDEPAKSSVPAAAPHGTSEKQRPLDVSRRRAADCGVASISIAASNLTTSNTQQQQQQQHSSVELRKTSSSQVTLSSLANLSIATTAETFLSTSNFSRSKRSADASDADVARGFTHTTRSGSSDENNANESTNRVNQKQHHQQLQTLKLRNTPVCNSVSCESGSVSSSASASESSQQQSPLLLKASSTKCSVKESVVNRLAKLDIITNNNNKNNNAANNIISGNSDSEHAQPQQPQQRHGSRLNSSLHDSSFERDMSSTLPPPTDDLLNSTKTVCDSETDERRWPVSYQRSAAPGDESIKILRSLPKDHSTVRKSHAVVVEENDINDDNNEDDDDDDDDDYVQEDDEENSEEKNNQKANENDISNYNAALDVVIADNETKAVKKRRQPVAVDAASVNRSEIARRSSKRMPVLTSSPPSPPPSAPPILQTKLTANQSSKRTAVVHTEKHRLNKYLSDFKSKLGRRRKASEERSSSEKWKESENKSDDALSLSSSTCTSSSSSSLSIDRAGGGVRTAGNRRRHVAEAAVSKALTLKDIFLLSKEKIPWSSIDRRSLEHLLKRMSARFIDRDRDRDNDSDHNDDDNSLPPIYYENGERIEPAQIGAWIATVEQLIRISDTTALDIMDTIASISARASGGAPSSSETTATTAALTPVRGSQPVSSAAKISGPAAGGSSKSFLMNKKRQLIERITCSRASANDAAWHPGEHKEKAAESGGGGGGGGGSSGVTVPHSRTKYADLTRSVSKLYANVFGRDSESVASIPTTAARETNSKRRGCDVAARKVLTSEPSATRSCERDLSSSSTSSSSSDRLPQQRSVGSVDDDRSSNSNSNSNMHSADVSNVYENAMFISRFGDKRAQSQKTAVGSVSSSLSAATISSGASDSRSSGGDHHKTKQTLMLTTPPSVGASKSSRKASLNPDHLYNEINDDSQLENTSGGGEKRRRRRTIAGDDAQTVGQHREHRAQPQPQLQHRRRCGQFESPPELEEKEEGVDEDAAQQSMKVPSKRGIGVGGGGRGFRPNSELLTATFSPPASLNSSNAIRTSKPPVSSNMTINSSSGGGRDGGGGGGVSSGSSAAPDQQTMLMLLESMHSEANGAGSGSGSGSSRSGGCPTLPPMSTASLAKLKSPERRILYKEWFTIIKKMERDPKFDLETLIRTRGRFTEHERISYRDRLSRQQRLRCARSEPDLCSMQQFASTTAASYRGGETIRAAAANESRVQLATAITAGSAAEEADWHEAPPPPTAPSRLPRRPPLLQNAHDTTTAAGAARTLRSSESFREAPSFPGTHQEAASSVQRGESQGGSVGKSSVGALKLTLQKSDIHFIKEILKKKDKKAIAEISNLKQQLGTKSNQSQLDDLDATRTRRGGGGGEADRSALANGLGRQDGDLNVSRGTEPPSSTPVQRRLTQRERPMVGDGAETSIISNATRGRHKEQQRISAMMTSAAEKNEPRTAHHDNVERTDAGHVRESARAFCDEVSRMVRGTLSSKLKHIGVGHSSSNSKTPQQHISRGHKGTHEEQDDENDNDAEDTSLRGDHSNDRRHSTNNNNQQQQQRRRRQQQQTEVDDSFTFHQRLKATTRRHSNEKTQLQHQQACNNDSSSRLNLENKLSVRHRDETTTTATTHRTHHSPSVLSRRSSNRGGVRDSVEPMSPPPSQKPPPPKRPPPPRPLSPESVEERGRFLTSSSTPLSSSKTSRRITSTGAADNSSLPAKSSSSSSNNNNSSNNSRRRRQPHHDACGDETLIEDVCDLDQRLLSKQHRTSGQQHQAHNPSQLHQQPKLPPRPPLPPPLSSTRSTTAVRKNSSKSAAAVATNLVASEADFLLSDCQVYEQQELKQRNGSSSSCSSSLQKPKLSQSSRRSAAAAHHILPINGSTTSRTGASKTSTRVATSSRRGSQRKPSTDNIESRSPSPVAVFQGRRKQ